MQIEPFVEALELAIDPAMAQRDIGRLGVTH